MDAIARDYWRRYHCAAIPILEQPFKPPAPPGMRRADVARCGVKPATPPPPRRLRALSRLDARVP